MTTEPEYIAISAIYRLPEREDLLLCEWDDLDVLLCEFFGCFRCEDNDAPCSMERLSIHGGPVDECREWLDNEDEIKRLRAALEKAQRLAKMVLTADESPVSVYLGGLKKYELAKEILRVGINND